MEKLKKERRKKEPIKNDPMPEIHTRVYVVNRRKLRGNKRKKVQRTNKKDDKDRQWGTLNSIFTIEAGENEERKKYNNVLSKCDMII